MPFRRCCIVAIILGVAGLNSARAYDQPTRVMTYVASADNVLSDLEYMVSELAGKPVIWEDKVFPNIDIFLIGLDTSQPIRVDSLLDSATGVRSLIMLPLNGGNANEFLNDNLDPIGVFNTPKELAPGRPPRPVLWELTSDPSAPIFDGWIRAANDYGYISSVKDDLPDTIAPPSDSHAHLVARGVDLGLQLLTPQEGETDRTGAFERYRENIVSALEQYDNESAEEFALRELVVHQQFERLEALFMETSELSALWTLDGGLGQLEILVAPLADTQLAADFEVSYNRESYFARVPMQADGVMNGRMNMTLSDRLKEQFSTFYVQAIPVVQAQIDNYDEYNADQRAARKTAIGIILQMLSDNAADGNVDAYIEISAATGGKHTMVSGLTFVSSDPISELLNAITGFGAGWTVEENVTTIGDVAVHKLHAGEGYPVSMAEFFGTDGDYYIGVDGVHVWVAAGVDSLQAMTTAIEQQSDESREIAHIPTFQLDFQFRPILKLAHEWAKESAVDLTAFFKKGGFANQTRERETAVRDDGEEPLMAAFKDFDWQGIILNTLEGSEARVETTFDVDEDSNLSGRSVIETDVLKAFGMVIAEFADEQL